MGKTKLEFIAKITTADGKVISKHIVEDIPSEEEFDISDINKYMSSLNEYERHA